MQEKAKFMSKQKDCFKCKHYYVTWDAKFPRGCKVYEVKSASVPSLVVAQATREGCTAFEEKANNQQKKKDSLDLNRDDLW